MARLGTFRPYGGTPLGLLITNTPPGLPAMIGLLMLIGIIVTNAIVLMGVFISKPLAIVVIGGLISSTLLTLILVPVLYTFIERRFERKTEKKARRRQARLEQREAREADRHASAPEAVEALLDS